AARSGGGVANAHVSPAAKRLSILWEGAPEQGHASYGVSDALREPPDRESSAVPLPVSGPDHDHVQSPGHPSSRPYDTGTAVPGNQMGGPDVLGSDGQAPPRGLTL